MTALIAFETTITSAMHYTEGKGVIADELCLDRFTGLHSGVDKQLGQG